MIQMKPIKTVLLSGFLTLGAFSLIAYTSCTKKDKDKCDGVVCQHNGTCVDGTCKCPTGYEGPNCETLSALKYAGFWGATDDCNIGDRTGAELEYFITISPNNSDPLKVDVKGVANTDYTLSATLGDSTLVISEQAAADNRTYSGEITYLTANTMKLKFNIKDSTGQYVEVCNSALQKN